MQLMAKVIHFLLDKDFQLTRPQVHGFIMNPADNYELVYLTKSGSPKLEP